MPTRGGKPVVRQPGRPGFFGSTQADDICRAYQAGTPTKQLAQQYGVCADTILRILRKAGIKPKRGPASVKRGPKDPHRARQIVEAYLAGTTIRKIAAQHDLTRQRIYVILASMGVPRNRAVTRPFQPRRRRRARKPVPWGR